MFFHSDFFDINTEPDTYDRGFQEGKKYKVMKRREATEKSDTEKLLDLDKNLGMGAFLNDDYIGISEKVYFDADVDPCWWINTEDLSNGMVQESDLRPCNEEHDHSGGDDHSGGSGRRLGSASYESEHDDQFFHSRPASRRLLTDPPPGGGDFSGFQG